MLGGPSSCRRPRRPPRRSRRDRPRGGGRGWPGRWSGRGGRRARRRGPPVAGRTKAIEPVVLEADFLAGVEVEVGHVERDAGAGPPLGLVERVVGGDQVAIDRRCGGGAGRGRRRRRASRGSCTGPGRAPGGRRRGSRGRPRGRPRAAARRCETPSIRAYISSLSAYFALKFRQNPPARTNGLSRSAAGSSSQPCRTASW